MLDSKDESTSLLPSTSKREEEMEAVFAAETDVDSDQEDAENLLYSSDKIAPGE